MAQQAAPQGAKASKWLALTAAVLAFSYTFLSRYIWSPLMTDVSNEFGISATQAGLYMSAFFMGYLITQIPGGLMADKLQPKYILIVCTLCSGLATALMSVIPGYAPGLALRIITGVCSGCVMANCSKIVAVNFAPQERAIGMGILLASPPFGITLADTLRDRLGFTGLKVGCGQGACGACTVIMNGKAVTSCMMLTMDCDGARIVTIEGLADAVTGELSGLQRSFVDNCGYQCGFCTPGIIMTAQALLEKNPEPTEEEVREALAGNYCRCGTHYSAVESIMAYVEKKKKKKEGCAQ